ncbi:FAD-dependent oxidoreductase [Longimonas halophila]|uniref:Pyridine nucleotide-disulfide oxidoreductase domain-containing protein 2 n=1 Tax=Longimonas halophila TaxID=1469170 RepID=A0A2H3NX72_9BACT|nr:FAD-dependent oxidoreductase [Longimonas halophila]
MRRCVVDFDVIVIGAGHNSLVCSAYLAQAGYTVGVFERRDIVGGAVSTKEIIPGYQFDLGGSAHILIRLTPIVEELELERFGLDYIDLDPLFFAPFDDTPVYIHRDVDKTVHHLNETFPGEGDNYRRFIDDWSGFARTMRDMFLRSPSPFQLGKSLVLGESSKLEWQDELRTIMRPYGHVVGEYFDRPEMRAMLSWMAAQSGPPPTEPMTGPFVLWHPLYHEGGVARPRGGSGMLTQALRQHIEHHGGSVFTDAEVSDILVENGSAMGIRSTKGEATARAVLSGTHILETATRLLPEEHRPRDFAKQVRVGNGFGAMLRLALDEPVSYTADPGVKARTGLQLLCRSPEQLHRAYGEYLGGQPSSDPPLVAMTFSAADPTLAPEGHEVLWLWGQYFPYELANGQSWDDIADDVANNLIDTFETYAPGIREHIVGQLFQHPAWLEKHLRLFRGNVMHVEMSIDQMFGNRPAMGWSQYKAPLDGLYLTGASTHPGGGIMGASGRNAARVLLRDLDRHRI